MNKYILIVFIFLFGALQAQTITKNPGNFTSVKVFDRISVQLIPGSEPKVEIKGDRAGEVQLVNNNGELKIRMPLKKLLKGETIEATIYYQKLEGVDASEGSYVIGETTIKGTQFSVGAKEGSEVRLSLEMKKTNIRVTSGGVIHLKGKSDNTDVVMSTGAELKAKSFETQQTTITMNAGGDAEIYATVFVDAKVRAGGDIHIYGYPKEVNQKTVVGGTITIVKPE